VCCFFFFNDTATTEIYTLSLHDALPISASGAVGTMVACLSRSSKIILSRLDRKSTRLNSSHPSISYAVFFLKKKTRDLNSFPTRSSSHSIGRPNGQTQLY